MMWPRFPYDPTPYDDDWEDQPGQGPFYQWALGVILPAILLCYGVAVMVSQQAEIGRFERWTFTGLNAIAIGIASLSACIFMHCHYFWGNVYDQAWPAVLGKILSAFAFVAALALLLIRNGVMGIQ